MTKLVGDEGLWSTPVVQHLSKACILRKGCQCFGYSTTDKAVRTQIW